MLALATKSSFLSVGYCMWLKLYLYQWDLKVQYHQIVFLTLIMKTVYRERIQNSINCIENVFQKKTHSA